MIKFSEKAKEHLKELYKNSNTRYIKLKITTKGCSGHSYDLSFVNESDLSVLDEKIQLEDSFIVVLDQKSIMWLMGTEIDWNEDLFGSKFDFTNPSIGGTCGCGESFHFKNESKPEFDIPN